MRGCASSVVLFLVSIVCGTCSAIEGLSFILIQTSIRVELGTDVKCGLAGGDSTS